jgi:diguanylate cyclase (GGDEF)-like protein
MTPMVILWEPAHSAGWQTLSEFIAAKLMPAARYGGDEFVLVLPETDSEVAWRVAQRISERLRNDGEEPPISVSAGAATFPGDGRTIDELLGAADRALYRGKAHPKEN